MCAFVLFCFSNENFSDFLIIYKNNQLILLFLFSGIIVSGLCYHLSLIAMKKIGVNKVAMALNLVPVSSFLLSISFLGEKFSSAHIFASIVVVLSMMLFSTQKLNKPTRTNQASPQTNSPLG